MKDSAYQQCSVSSSVQASTGSLIAGRKVAIDNCTISVNSGSAVYLTIDYSTDEVYPLLSRNSDLTGLTLTASDDSTVVIADCDEDWTFNYDLAAMRLIGVSYEPACPSDAICTNYYSTQASLQCVCPTGSVYTNLYQGENFPLTLVNSIKTPSYCFTPHFSLKLVLLSLYMYRLCDRFRCVRWHSSAYHNCCAFSSTH